MISTAYIESMERELAFYRKEQEFEATLPSGTFTDLLRILTKQRIAFLEKEIAVLKSDPVLLSL